MATFQSSWDAASAGVRAWQVFGEDVYASLPNLDIKGTFTENVYTSVGGDIPLSFGTDTLTATSIDVVNGTGLVIVGWPTVSTSILFPIINAGVTSVLTPADINNDRGTPISLMTAWQYDTSVSRQQRDYFQGMGRFGWNHRSATDNGHWLQRPGEGFTDYTSASNYPFGGTGSPWCFERVIAGGVGYLRADAWSGSFPEPETMTLRATVTLEPVRAMAEDVSAWDWDPVTGVLRHQYNSQAGSAFNWTLLGAKVSAFV